MMTFGVISGSSKPEKIYGFLVNFRKQINGFKSDWHPPEIKLSDECEKIWQSFNEDRKC